MYIDNSVLSNFYSFIRSLIAYVGIMRMQRKEMQLYECVEEIEAMVNGHYYPLSTTFFFLSSSSWRRQTLTWSLSCAPATGRMAPCLCCSIPSDLRWSPRLNFPAVPTCGRFSPRPKRFVCLFVCLFVCVLQVHYGVCGFSYTCHCEHFGWWSIITCISFVRVIS